MLINLLQLRELATIVSHCVRWSKMGALSELIGTLILSAPHAPQNLLWI